MNREEAIKIIEQLYPADAPYTDTATVGRQLLAEARATKWRYESYGVIVEYARLCEKKERIADRAATRRKS